MLEENIIELLVDTLRNSEVPARKSFTSFVKYPTSNPVQDNQEEVAKARALTIKALSTLARHGEKEVFLSSDYQINAKLRLADVRKILLKTSIINDLCRMLRDQDDDVRNAAAEAFIRLAKHGTCLHHRVRHNCS